MKSSIARKRTSTLFSIACVLAVFSCPTFLRAGVLVDLGTTAPTPGLYDQYYLPTSGVGSTNIYNTNDPSATLQYGETFTTGSNASGYTLNDIILQVNFNYEKASGNLSIPFTIQNSTQTALIAPAESVTGITGNAGLMTQGGFNGHYIEYTFATPITLAANTQYSLVGGYSTSGATVQFAGTSADGYAGGAAFSNTTDGGTLPADLVFDVGLTQIGSVPEPTTWAMMIGGFGMLMIFQRRRRNL